MPEAIVYLNGEFVPASRAKLNIFDFGVILGATLTEMTRTFAHRPFRLEDHAARLLRSCKYAGIGIGMTQDDLVEATQAVISHNVARLKPEEDLAAVHVVTPGESWMYAGIGDTKRPPSPTICIHTFPLPFHAWSHYYREGAHLIIPATRHVPPECVDPKTKNRSRLHWFLAEQQARLGDPQAIPLLLDLSGNLTECAGANFVIVRDGVILSPTSRNILQGVSLATVRELAPAAGLEFEERDLQVYDAVNSGEAWMCSTPYCIAPVTRINGASIGDGRPGPACRRMLAAWGELVGVDIQRQLLG